MATEVRCPKCKARFTISGFATVVCHHPREYGSGGYECEVVSTDE